MKQIKTLIDKKSTKEFMQGYFRLSLVSFGVSFLMIALYIIFGILNSSWADPLQIVLVVSGGVLLVLSILMLTTYLNTINKTKSFIRTIVYDFNDETISFDIFREEEKIESGKIYYQDFVEYKESKNYIFLKLKNNTWLAIDKEEGLIDFIKSKGLKKHGLFSNW